jgi:hypothetical protein
MEHALIARRTATTAANVPIILLMARVPFRGRSIRVTYRPRQEFLAHRLVVTPISDGAVC